MLIWGNKKYAIDKLIEDNGLQNLKKHLADLVWGKMVMQSGLNYNISCIVLLEVQYSTLGSSKEVCKPVHARCSL